MEERALLERYIAFLKFIKEDLSMTLGGTNVL
jgi:hypothetical protein